MKRTSDLTYYPFKNNVGADISNWKLYKRCETNESMKDQEVKKY